MDKIIPEIDKKKGYRPKNTPSKVEEPMVAYSSQVMPLAFLSVISSRNLPSTKLPGKALTALQNETSLTPQEIADILGVSKSKYYDLIKMTDLGQKNIDALADFATLWNKGIEAFDGDKQLLREWLLSRNENLGGIQPIKLLSSRIGRRELENAFLRIEHSLYG